MCAAREGGDLPLHDEKEEGPRSGPPLPRGQHVREGPMPSWVCGCIWRLLSPPCRVGEISHLSCEAVAALSSDTAERGAPIKTPPGGQRPGGHSGFSHVLTQWQRLETQARDAEKTALRGLGGPLPPPRETQLAQEAAGALLVTYGGVYGVVCFASGEGGEEQNDAGGDKNIGMVLCNCALWRLHSVALRCINTSLGTSPSFEDSLPALPSDHWGPPRLLLTITGEMQAAQAATERRLVFFQRLLGPQGPLSTLPGTPLTAGQYCDAIGSLLEDLRASRLPLLLHPKASEVWALRRQQLRLCVRLLQHQLVAKMAAAADAGPPTPCTSGPSRASEEALQRECRELSRGTLDFTSWQSTGQGALRDGEGETPLDEGARVVLLLLESELRFSSWHLKSRSHSYQAAEHAHRVLCIVHNEIAAAAACSSDTPQEAAEKPERHQQQPVHKASLLLRLLSEIEKQERHFWRFICQTAPSHFAGGQQLLRLLSLDLQQLLQQHLATTAPLKALWLAGQLSPEGAATARATETLEEGRRILLLFPMCEAAWRLCTYALVSLIDWAGAVTAECSDPKEALRDAALPPLSALVRAEKQWVAEMPPCLFGKRHVDTLDEELQLFEQSLTPHSC